MNNIFTNFLISFLTFIICIFIANLTGIQNITYAVLFIFLIHLLIFVPSYFFQTEKFFDLTGTISYVSSVLFIFFKSNTVELINFGSLVLSTFIIIWSLRLGTFLFLRIKKAGKDRRFNEIKKSFSWFFMAFSTSGMWVTICSICALTGIANGIIFSTTTIIGIIIFIIGCFKQLSETELLHKRNPIGFYGDKITNAQKKEISSLIHSPNEYIGKNVLISGKIIEVCPMRGCWMIVEDYNKKSQIRIKVLDGEIVFPLSSKGNCVNAFGKFTKLNFSEEQAINWKIHLAEEKGITLLPEDVILNTDDLIEYRINANGAKIFSLGCK